MTSRRLWLLLIVLATPLILYGTTGCQILFTLNDADPRSNAYTCGCACNPGPRDVASAIAVDNDDAEERRSDGAILLGNGDLRMTSEFFVGLRFAVLGIPQGAVISSAYVQFTAAQTDPLDATVTVRIEDSDDAAPITGTGFNLSLRSVAAAPVSWTSGAWTSNAQGPAQQTADLTALVQSVVIRPAWTDVSSLVLIFDATAGSRIAVSADAAGTRQPVLHVTYVDNGATITANIPVCLDEADNPFLNPNAANPETDGDGDGLPDVLANDCADRVENTYRGLVETCGYVPNPSANCNCEIVPTGFHDLNENHTSDAGEDYFGFTREICNVGPPTCAETLVDTDPATLCSNFNPEAFGLCVEENLVGCGQNSIPPEDCNLDDCLAFVTATNASENDRPLCIAHASAAPAPLAFHLFGQRSLCEVEGLSEIAVGEDGREPKKSPLTRGTLEILGRPSPGASCIVGVSTQLAMNPITFDVRWASDPTFSNLIEAGNSSIGAGSLSALGVGMLAAESTTNVGRGRRGSKRQAFLGTNSSPLDLTVDWAGYACSLGGNLAGALDAESAEGTCQGDDTVVCLKDSPDCDDGGGPCNLPQDEQLMVVDVALAGTLVNQPPTANAGPDQTVECTSSAGAAFELDGGQSSDPDSNDIRIVSWREGSRVGPEVAFDRTLRLHGTLGVGESQTYVLRIIDSLAQADEDTASAEVVDTTPPDVLCNTGLVVPPNKPVSFTATATDLCTAGAIVPALIDYECFKINGAGKVVDKTKSCKVTLNGPTVTIKNTGGVGQHIAWIARGVDGSGNAREVTCEVVVANPGHN